MPDPLQFIIANNIDDVGVEQVGNDNSAGPLPQLEHIANTNANSNDKNISTPPQLEHIAINNSDSVLAPSQLDPITNNKDNSIRAPVQLKHIEDVNQIPLAAIIVAQKV